MPTAQAEPPPLIEVLPLGMHEGRPYQHVRFNLHDGQRRALESRKRFVLVLAGWRSGKTAIGPLWMLEQMRERGPGDYLIAAPDFPLLSKSVAPSIENLFTRLMHLGRLNTNPMEYRISRDGERALWGDRVIDRPTRIIFGHADEPDSLASMQANAAWLDEPGQKKFKAGSFEEVQARLAIGQGRCLLTTRPYTINWVKHLLFDPWEAAGCDHPDIDVINFESIMNPVFPRDEDERARRELPRWKYLMQYRGLFTRPAGAIYSNFDSARHVYPAQAVPDDWDRFLGLDFGGVNTAGVFLAREFRKRGKPRYRVYREYHAGERSAAQHAAALLAGEPMHPLCVGGSKSEGQWRREFAAGGLAVREPPISDVEVGIDRVFACIGDDRLWVSDACPGLKAELESYSRVLGPDGKPTEAIDDKESYHRLDALRYVIAWLERFGDDAAGIGSGGSNVGAEVDAAFA